LICFEIELAPRNEEVLSEAWHGFHPTAGPDLYLSLA